MFTLRCKKALEKQVLLEALQSYQLSTEDFIDEAERDGDGSTVKGARVALKVCKELLALVEAKSSAKK